MSATWMEHLTPLLFHQLHVIRAPLRYSSISYVYPFLFNKSQSTYEELLQSIQNKCQELGFQSDPLIVITDFKLAIINAVGSTFGRYTKSHGCFYHLIQNTWRKIQSLGLVHLYQENDNVKLFYDILNLNGLASLPIGDVASGIQYLMFEH